MGRPDDYTKIIIIPPPGCHWPTLAELEEQERQNRLPPNEQLPNGQPPSEHPEDAREDSEEESDPEWLQIDKYGDDFSDDDSADLTTDDEKDIEDFR